MNEIRELKALITQKQPANETSVVNYDNTTTSPTEEKSWWQSTTFFVLTFGFGALICLACGGFSKKPSASSQSDRIEPTPTDTQKLKIALSDNKPEKQSLSSSTVKPPKKIPSDVKNMNAVGMKYQNNGVPTVVSSIIEDDKQEVNQFQLF